MTPLLAVMRSCALVLGASVSTEMPSTEMLKEKGFLVFLRRTEDHRDVKGRWHFASLFGATKNVMPLKEAPNVFVKCAKVF